MTKPQIVWLRRDLRLADQAALLAASRSGAPVIPVYVLDDETPKHRRMGGASRWWLHHSLASLDEALRRAWLAADPAARALRGGACRNRAGNRREHSPCAPSLRTLVAQCRARGRQHARSSSPSWQLPRPARIGADRIGNAVQDLHAVLARAGAAHAAARAHRRTEADFAAQGLARIRQARRLEAASRHGPIGRAACAMQWTPGEASAHERLDAISPIMRATMTRSATCLRSKAPRGSLPHLHFGEVSPAAVWHAVADAGGSVGDVPGRAWLARLCAERHCPVPRLFGAATTAREFDALAWRDPERDAGAARISRHGSRAAPAIPIVDAGMRQLWATGWMHNRVRMIAASFLIKHLLIDWRHGERWFWDTLVDADYAQQRRQLAMGRRDRGRCEHVSRGSWPRWSSRRSSTRQAISGSGCPNWPACPMRNPRSRRPAAASGLSRQD